MFNYNPTQRCLECEKKEEGHHKTEETHSFRESESQDSVGEQLLLEAGVPGEKLINN